MRLAAPAISYLLLGSALSPKLSNVFFTVNYQSSETESNLIGFNQERDTLAFAAQLQLSFLKPQKRAEKAEPDGNAERR